jgi:hypothetical protein
MPTSSIDDLLLGGGNATQPETPEHQHLDGPEEIEEMDSPDYGLDDEEASQSHEESSDDADDLETSESQAPEKEYDDYGNEKPKPRTYTQEEVNEMFRRRFKNKPQDEQHAVMQQIQQSGKQFEFDPDSTQSLPQQLESFVEQTVQKMTQKREAEEAQRKDREIQEEFEEKFSSGMQKFHDFRDVMLGLPFEITNPMTLATRSMADPAAFLYAAAKRNPQELERISKLRDPYAQMTEIGKLEERMRRNKPTTKAPRPLGRTQEDSVAPQPKKKTEPSIEDLIAKSDAKRMQRLRGRSQGGRR